MRMQEPDGRVAQEVSLRPRRRFKANGTPEDLEVLAAEPV